MMRVLPGLQISNSMVQSTALAILTLVLLVASRLSPFLALTTDQHGFLQQDPVCPHDPKFPGFINRISAAAAARFLVAVRPALIPSREVC
jgi:hypothetical protein